MGSSPVWVNCLCGVSVRPITWPGAGRPARLPRIAPLPGKASRFDHLNIMSVPVEALAELAALCQRSMQLTATVQDGTLWLSSEQGSTSLTPLRLYGGDGR